MRALDRNTRTDPDDFARDDAYLVRLMTAADLPAVIGIDRKYAQRERSAFYQGKFAACVGEPGINTSLIAESDGLPVGFLFGQVFFGEFGIPVTRAVLDAIGVLPDFRTHGVAKALFQQYCKNLSGLRVDAIDTLVEWNRFDLLGFFSALGFRPSRVVDMVWDTARYPFAGKSSDATIRRATAADLPAVIAIGEETGMPPQSRYLAAKLAAAQAKPARNLFIVAETGGAVAAFMIGSLYEGEFGITEPRGVIDVFAVRESRQHSGIGSAIVGDLLARIRKLQVRHMETLVRWNNWPLLEFYEYVGFRPSHRLNLELHLNPDAAGNR
jgi:ribosomal protein S18 acetylase RimI-like enzyme